jgi:tetratricopeptide (TPR) repeat protein
MLAEPALIGRERELTELEQYLTDTLKGQGGTVFISGEAGSGKTRIATEFLNLCRKRNLAVLSGWCLNNSSMPYFPFIEAFESFSSDISYGSQVTVSRQLNLKLSLIGRLSNDKENSMVTPQAWKDQAFASVTKELLFVADNKPLILFIDDLHWADSASLSLLHYLARAIKSETILVLATFRPEEIGFNPEGFAHPLIDTLRLMGREDLFRELKLSKLNECNVARIAENMLNGKVKQEFVTKLFEESGGNPLYIIESLRMLFENNSLNQKSGEWQLSADKIAVPLKVKDIILRRLNALKPTQRRILDVASVIGEKFDPQLLGAVLNQDSLEVLETLNGIALSRSLVSVENDYYRFDHAKSREVLYEELFLPLKNGYHQRIAEKIESLNRDSKNFPFSDLAYHYTKAGNKEKSIEYNLSAGKDALARFSNAEAVRNFTYVTQAVEDNSKYWKEKIEAVEGLGDAFCASGLFEQAINSYQKLLSSVESEAVKLRALRKSVVASYWRGDSKHALELAAQARNYQQADRLEYARVRLFKGFVAARSLAQFNEAFGDMKSSLDVFEEMYSIPDVASALVEISFVYPWIGKFKEALSSAMRAVALYEELGDIRQHAFALGRLGTALGYCTLVKEALETFAKANLIDEKIGDYNTMAFHFMMSGIYLEKTGNNTAAIIESLKGLEAAEKTDAAYAKSLCLANLIREYSMCGDINRACEFQKKLDTLFVSDPMLKNNSNALVQTQLSKAMLLNHKGQHKEAIKLFEKYFQIDQFEWKNCYAVLLQNVGRLEEASLQRKKIKEKVEKIAKIFDEPNLEAYLLLPREAKVNEEIKVRLDILNLGKKDLHLEAIKKITLPNVKATLLSVCGKLENETIQFIESKIAPLSLLTLKLTFIVSEPGVYNLKPYICYTDNLNNKQTQDIDQITITVKSNDSSPHNQSTTKVELVQVQFKSESTQKIHDFLIKAFKEDSLQRYPSERCGWRTFNETIKQSKVSKYSVYGTKGNYGQAICELEKNGFVETRIFTGERGRGGNISKIRIARQKKQ